MNYGKWWFDYIAGALILAAIFYFWDSAPGPVLSIASAVFAYFVYRVISRSWKGFAEKLRTNK
jgi:hypothetical protein